MNYIQNDKGQTVPAIGAPGSIKRCEAQYPRLIDRLNALYFECEGLSLSYARGLALDMISESGVTSAMERESILANTEWWTEPA